LALKRVKENYQIMSTNYESNVKATIAFLKLLKVKVNNTTVDETLQNHPDWPSLLCISDSLNKWNIPNGAGKIDPNDIGQLPIPFIAYTYEKENPLVVITQVTDITIQAYQINYNKPVTESKEDFIKRWNGIYLVAEPTETSGEPNYETNKRKAFFNSLVSVAVFTALIIISFLFLNRIVEAANPIVSFSTTGIYLQWLILLTGVVVTSMLLWYEIDKSNNVLQKICSGIAKGNCNAILTGKQAKVFEWLSWSEVGVFYFTGSLLILLFAENTAANSVAVLSWINILALPYTVFSVYYQWRVAKQWCVLCLAVQALLLLGGINVIANNFLFPIPVFSFLLIANCLLLFMLPVAIWYAVKPHILRLQYAMNLKREYLRIKFNSEIFDILLKKQKQVTHSTDGLGITLGNANAAHELVKVCNPYCGPCGKAHPEIEKLLAQNNNIKARIIFTATNDEHDRAAKPVKHLIAIADNDDELQIKKALDDWYLAEKKDYDVFAAKYPMNGELKQQDEKINAMAKWCKNTDIQFTPTIFINGYQLPNAYGIEDLKYFLLD
jgi:uncharacterized membrane protein